LRNKLRNNRKISNEALDAVRQAKESADEANNKEKEALKKAQDLEIEMESVRQKMYEKLELARTRTKEWLHQQTSEITEKSLQKENEIKRLQFEIEKIQKEEQMEKEKMKQGQTIIQNKIDQIKIEEEKQEKLEKQEKESQERLIEQKEKESQLQALVKAQEQAKIQTQAQLQLQQQLLEQQQQLKQQQEQLQQQMLQNKFQFWQRPIYDVDALQVEEQSSVKMPTKEEVYEKLVAMHQKLENLLGKSGTGEMPSIPIMDLERNSDSDYKLQRRQTKTVTSQVQSLPSGYPPPSSTSKLQADMANIELSEGLSAPVIAQGDDNESNPLNLTGAHKKNCLKICSGGDKTVYRNGVVSTEATEQSTTHETGACMKMCASFVIEAQQNCDGKTSKC